MPHARTFVTPSRPAPPVRAADTHRTRAHGSFAFLNAWAETAPAQSGILSRNRVATHTEHAATASGIRLAGLRAGVVVSRIRKPLTPSEFIKFAKREAVPGALLI